MATTGLCRYERYVIVTAQLEGTGEFSVDVCEEPATHRVIVRAAGDGLAVEVDAEVCTRHERVVSDAAGHERSIKLRRPVRT